MTIPLARISLAEAQAAIAAAVNEAEQRGVSVAIVVVDDSGRLVACARMDSSALMAMDIATGKAYTAVGQGQPTSMWDEYVENSPGFAGAITSVPGFTPFGGGVCIVREDKMVGAIGVSGGALTDDIAIAECGAQAG